MIHLRIVAPSAAAQRALELLLATPTVCNVIHLPAASRQPDGDVILCDVAREEASVVLADLRTLRIPSVGSIAVEDVDTQLSAAAQHAERRARGSPTDAVVWEEVESRTSESAELSGSFAVFMVIAALIAAVGIYLNTPILIVGAMVVGPEFGPIAGFCVAAVNRRPGLALRSALALVVGFPLAIASTLIASLIFRATALTPERFDKTSHSLSAVISSPDFFAFFVAFCAGVAGMLSLSTAKSGALIGVLISVTTIPAAANVGVAAAYGDTSSLRGSLAQLGINLGSILVAGLTTLALQRALFRRRQRRHWGERAHGAASVPVRWRSSG